MARRGRTRRKGKPVSDFDHAAGVDQARYHRTHIRRKAVQTGLSAHFCKALCVYRGGVFFIGSHGDDAFVGGEGSDPPGEFG
jgi:hypothetical protein